MGPAHGGAAGEMPEPTDADLQALTPEDDYFARVALHNKLVTREQVVACANLIAKAFTAGHTRHTLASVLIQRGYLRPEYAAAVQKAVQKHAAEQAKADRTKKAPEPKPAEPKQISAAEAAEAAVGRRAPTKTLRRRAPAGDSQVLVPVDKKKKKKGATAAEDKRMRLREEPGKRTATLEVACSALYSNDAPGFEAACTRLIGTGQLNLVIDMRAVKRIPSLLFGELTKAQKEAEAAGKKLTVVLNKETGRVAKMILGGLVRMRIV